MKKYVLILIIFVSLLTSFIIFYEKNRYPEHHFIIPMDYKGWVVITFDQPGLPALTKQRNKIFYHVPTSGQIKTSSKNESGSVYGYYIDDNGKKTNLTGNMIHVHGTTSSSLSPETLRIFIGTEETWIRERDHPPF